MFLESERSKQQIMIILQPYYVEHIFSVLSVALNFVIFLNLKRNRMETLTFQWKLYFITNTYEYIIEI